MADEVTLVEQADGSALIEDPSLETDTSGEDTVEGGEAPVIEEDQRLTPPEGEGDEEGHAEETDEEAEARRQRNRARRAQNKNRRNDYIESLKRELASRDAAITELTTRVASVEQARVGNEMVQLDESIKEAERYYNHFKAINQQAIEQANGAAAVDAQEKMFAAQQRHAMLVNAKKRIGQQATQPRPLDPRMARYAQDWMDRNKWYDPAGKDSTDLDTRLAATLDADLHREGWNPTTKEYWDELDARVGRYLPHRVKPEYNGSNPPRKPPKVPVGGGGQGPTGSKKGSYRLSPERVQALKESGSWDDPQKRADGIKRYQQYDKEHANGN